MARLQKAGETIAAYDPNMAHGSHLESQISYVRNVVPSQAVLMEQLSGLMLADADSLIASSDVVVVVVSHATDEFRRAVKARAKNVHILDLARLFPALPADATYQGIAW